MLFTLPLLLVTALPAGFSDEGSQPEAEGYRRLPPAERARWRELVRDPPLFWRDRTRRFVNLDGLHPQAELPDGTATFRFRARIGEAPPRLVAATVTGRFELIFSRLPDQDASIDLSWGPPKTGLLFLRSSFQEGDLRAIRYTVVDLGRCRVLSETYR